MVMWVLRGTTKYNTDEEESMFYMVCPTYKDAVDFIEVACSEAVYVRAKESEKRPIESLLVDDKMEEYYNILDYWIGRDEDGLVKLDIFPIEYFKMPREEDENEQMNKEIIENNV